MHKFAILTTYLTSLRGLSPNFRGLSPRARGFFSLLLLGALVGCDSAKTVESRPYSQLDADAVLVSVEDVHYTKGELERDLSIRMDLQKVLFGSFATGRVDVLSKQFRASALEQFVAREVLLTEARRRRVELANDELLAYQEKFSHGLSDRVPVTFKALEPILQSRFTPFRRSIAKDALAAKIRTTLRFEARDRAVVSDDEVRQTLEGAQASNAAFSITNRMTFALATNAWKSIVRGNDFALVGKKLHQMNPYITFIESCETDDASAAQLKKDGVTPPVLGERGLSIYRAKDAPGTKNRYSSIFFALAPIYQIESFEETRRTLIESRVNELYEARFKALRAAADIHYPYGPNPFHD